MARRKWSKSHKYVNTPTPSAAIYNQYLRWLRGIIKEMERDIIKNIEQHYAPPIARDAAVSPLAGAAWFRLLTKKWLNIFDKEGARRAAFFAGHIRNNVTRRFLNELKDALAITVKFKTSKRLEKVYEKIVTDNVNLIKTIPREYLTEVNDIVTESINRGRDMGYLREEIQKRFRLDDFKAIRIARDQTNKATEAISRTRAEDLGITHGIWMHRSGGKVPRSTHLTLLNGKRFDLKKGLYDPEAWKLRGGDFRGEWIKPAQLINCHCTFKMDVSSIVAAATDSVKRGGAVIYRFPAAEVTINYMRLAA